MADVKWVKLSIDMFDNRKIKYLRRLPEGDQIVLIWVMLLSMAGKCNANGMIFITEDIPYTVEILADELGFKESTVLLALNQLEKLDMIRMKDEFFYISGWEDHQNIEGMDRIREQNRIRKQNQRERERLALEDKAAPEAVEKEASKESESGDFSRHAMSRDSHATDKNRIDKNRIDNNIKEKDKKEKQAINENVDGSPTEKNSRKNFKPPTVDEVRAFVMEIGHLSECDPEAFVDFYSSKGWKVGSAKMSNWKAAVRNWIRRTVDDRASKQTRPANQWSDIQQHDDWDWNQLEAISRQRLYPDGGGKNQ